MVEYARIPPGADLEPQVEELVDGEFAPGFGGPYWRWKYRHAAIRDAAGVYTATEDGTVVAVVHSLRSRFRLNAGWEVDGVVAGDLVTDSDHRGRAVAGRLSMFANQDAKNWGADPTVVLMWTRPRLGRFYTKALGYTRVPAGTVRYEKRLGTSDRLAQVSASGLLDRLEGRLPADNAPPVEFCIDGTIPFRVAIEDGRIELSDSGHRRVGVAGARRVVMAYLAGEHPKLVWAERMRRRLRIRGSVAQRRRLAPFSNIYLEILTAVLDG